MQKLLTFALNISYQFSKKFFYGNTNFFFTTEFEVHDLSWECLLHISKFIDLRIFYT
jgi:hypothetical protein